jgi:hypothetical protein
MGLQALGNQEDHQNSLPNTLLTASNVGLGALGSEGRAHPTLQIPGLQLESIHELHQIPETQLESIQQQAADTVELHQIPGLQLESIQQQAAGTAELNQLQKTQLESSQQQAADTAELYQIQKTQHESIQQQAADTSECYESAILNSGSAPCNDKPALMFHESVVDIWDQSEGQAAEFNPNSHGDNWASLALERESAPPSFTDKFFAGSGGSVALACPTLEYHEIQQQVAELYIPSPTNSVSVPIFNQPANQTHHEYVVDVSEPEVHAAGSSVVGPGLSWFKLSEEGLESRELERFPSPFQTTLSDGGGGSGALQVTYPEREYHEIQKEASKLYVSSPMNSVSVPLLNQPAHQTHNEYVIDVQSQLVVSEPNNQAVGSNVISPGDMIRLLSTHGLESNLTKPSPSTLQVNFSDDSGGSGALQVVCPEREYHEIQKQAAELYVPSPMNSVSVPLLNQPAYQTHNEYVVEDEYGQAV